MKKVYVVCAANMSRSQAIEEFLSRKYAENPEIRIKSAGLDVNVLGDEDKRTRFTREMAEEADIIFTSDHDKFNRVRYHLLNNDEKNAGKLHLLRIPDVFHVHRNVIGPNANYDQYLRRIISEPDFDRLSEYIGKLSLKGASALVEALYTRDLGYSLRTNSGKELKKYPFELLYKALEFRFPWMNEIIEKVR